MALAIRTMFAVSRLMRETLLGVGSKAL
jgi:hypothetical protein